MPERMSGWLNYYVVFPEEGIYSSDGALVEGVVKVESEWPDRDLMLLQRVDERFEGGKKYQVKRSEFFGTGEGEP